MKQFNQPILKITEISDTDPHDKIQHQAIPEGYLKRTTKPDLQVNEAICRAFEDLTKLAEKLWEDEREEQERVIELTHCTGEEEFVTASKYVYKVLKMLETEQHYKIKTRLPKIVWKSQRQQQIIASTHERSHWAEEKMLSAQELYWDHMRTHILEYVRNCPNCANKKNERRIRADAVLIDAAKKPFDILNIDKFNFKKKKISYS